MWNQPNRVAGRFNARGSGPVQYLCLHPLGPLAEAVRRLPTGLSAERLRMPVWALRIAEGTVQTIGFEQAAEWGIDPYALVCPPEGYRECQGLGEIFMAMDDPPMLRVPSAALPGTWNLVVFGARVSAPYAIDGADPDLDVPCAPVAVAARPLEELVPLVRGLEQLPHAAHDAWLDGDPFEFPDPQPLSLDI